MKSQSATVLDIYVSVFEDARRIWPDAAKGFGKDLSYLRRAVEQRGLPFLTITLPTFGKMIDRSLDLGAFMASDIPQGIPQNHGKPVFLRDFLMKVFDDSGTLKAEVDVTAIYFLRQICYLMKKWRAECHPRYTEQTLDEFFAIEDRLPHPWPSTWDDNRPVWIPRYGHPLWGETGTGDSSQLSLLDDGHPRDLRWDSLRLLCRRVVHSWEAPDWWEILPKHGPGAVSESKGSFISKYEMPNWPQKLGEWFAFDWFGTGIIDTDHTYTESEPPSRLVAVPKSQKGPRLICCEPLAHQWMQQGIWRWLERAVEQSLLGHSISFRDQEKSREAALDASIGGDRCTIDLSSASDRLSCRLVEFVFQESPILDGLHACRTRLMSQTLSPKHPKVIKLKKFAPMGSTVTFPGQSIVFTLLAVHALRMSEGRCDDWSNLEGDFDRVRVFGDDIIAPNASYEAIVSVLTECGLKVNLSKSYTGSNFRESCGAEGFQGVDVTPAYLLQTYDGSATSMAAVIETSNNFHKKGCWKTAETIANLLPPKELKLLQVVGDEDGGQGLYSFQGRSVNHLRKKWNPYLHRDEYIALLTTAKVDKVQGTGLSGLTQYFTERPDPMLPWESGQARIIRVRKTRMRVT